jgi:hypothetical protein
MIEIDLISGIFLSFMGIFAISSLVLVIKVASKTGGKDDFQTEFGF